MYTNSVAPDIEPQNPSSAGDIPYGHQTTFLRPRRLGQFSLKTLFLAITLICVGPGGFVAYHQQYAIHQKANVQRLSNLGAEIYYDDTMPKRTAFWQFLLGDEHYGTLAIVSFGTGASVRDNDLAYISGFPKLKSLLLHDQFTDACLLHVARIRSLSRLDLSQSRVTDSGLAQLSELTQLERLFLSNTSITDSGVTHISQLPHLEYLYLNGTLVSDVGLAQIADIKSLKQLVLDDTPITDRGVKQLKGLRSLNVLSITNTKVTEKAIIQLKKDLPDTAIFY